MKGIICGTCNELFYSQNVCYSGIKLAGLVVINKIMVAKYMNEGDRLWKRCFMANITKHVRGCHLVN